MDKRIAVVIVDYNPLSRAGLTMLLSDEVEVAIADTADNLKEAIQHLRMKQLGIIVFNVASSRSTVTDDILLCRSQLPHFHVLAVITRKETRSFVIELMALGTAGLIFIDDLESLPTAMHALANGGSWYSDDLLSSLFQDIVSPFVLALTPREFQVLILLAKGLRNAQIATQLFVSTKTVEFHVHNILVKMEASSRTEAVHRAYESDIITLNE